MTDLDRAYIKEFPTAWFMGICNMSYKEVTNAWAIWKRLCLHACLPPRHATRYSTVATGWHKRCLPLNCKCSPWLELLSLLNLGSLRRYIGASAPNAPTDMPRWLLRVQCGEAASQIGSGEQTTLQRPPAFAACLRPVLGGRSAAGAKCGGL